MAEGKLTRLRSVPSWLVLGIAGVLVVLTRWLPAADARQLVLDRGAPVLAFLIAITVLAALSDRAGVFDAAAGVCARLAGGSTIRLFLLIAVLGTLTTVMMSLDTTAVLLTPVVLSLTAQLGLRAEPFAMLAVWLANTASMLLPVANLTNLLALQREQLSTSHFAARMALPELAAVVVTTGYLAAVYRRDLSGYYECPAARPPEDEVIFWACGAACVALAPAVVLGVTPWIAATPCAGVAVLAFAVRSPGQLRWSVVPWRIVIVIQGLILAVAALSRHGLTSVLAQLAGQSSWRTEVTAAVASNAVNNLPAFLAVEPTVPAGQQTRLLAVLLGTNAGPLIALWGSLATLLWRQHCRNRGVQITPGRFALVGLGGVPLVLLATWAGLRLTG